MNQPPSRPLGTFERAQVSAANRFAFNLVVALRLDGPLAAAALRRALDALQQRHAVLRARIGGPPRRPCLEAGGVGEIPLDVIEAAEEDGWQRCVEEDLSARFEISTGPLARCTLLASPPGGSSDLVLTVHHAIVDARAAHHLLGELLALCDGQIENASPRGLPARADDRFPAAFRSPRCWSASALFAARQLAEEAAYRWSRAGRGRPPGTGPFACRILAFALSEQETHALVRATRRMRVGMTSALNAAMMLAIARRSSAARTLRQRYFAMPDLRPYLVPPVSGDVVANYSSMMRLAQTVSDGQDLWRLAARIHTQLERAARRGDGFLASRWSALSMRAVLSQQKERMGTIGMSYAGAVDFPAGRRLGVDGLHAFVSNFPLGPEYTAQARIFRRRLWWDIVTLDVDMDRNRALDIARDMGRALIEATSSAQTRTP